LTHPPRERIVAVQSTLLPEQCPATEVQDVIPELMMEIIREKLGDRIGEYLIPAPIADTLGSELLTFDAESGTLTARFPVLEKYLNP
jgi:hypothetical protein